MKCKLREYCATEPFLLLYWIATGIHLSVLPQLVIKKLCFEKYNTTICSSLNSETYQVQNSVIYNDAANWNTAIFLTVAIPSICQITGYGLASDIIGTRILLLLPPLAMALQSVIYLLSAKFMTLSVGLIVFGASVTCPYGDAQGAIMLAYSYLADITNPNQRTLRMTILESTIPIGQAFGSYFAGLLLQRFNFVAVFSTSLAISILNFLYVAIILPAQTSDTEYINPNPDESVACTGYCRRLLNVIKEVLRQMPVRLKTFFSYLSFSKEGKTLIPVLIAVFFTSSAILGENVMIILFLKHSPLNLSSIEIGQYLLLLFNARGFGVIVVGIIVVKVFKPPDLVLALIGLVSLFLTHIFMGISSTPVMLYALSPVSICIPLAMSVFRSVVTKHVSPREHSVALTAIAVVTYVGLIVMTLCANNLFKATASFYSGAAILLLASSSLIACFITLALFVITKYKKKDIAATNITEMTDAEGDPLLAPQNKENTEIRTES